MTANQEVDAETQRLRKRGARILWLIAGGPCFTIILLIILVTSFAVLTNNPHHPVSSGVDLDKKVEADFHTFGWFMLPPTAIVIIPLLAIGMWRLCRGKPPSSRLFRSHRLLLLASLVPVLVLTLSVPDLAFGVKSCYTERYSSTFGDQLAMGFCLMGDVITAFGLIWFIFSLGLVMRYHRFDPDTVFRRFLITMIGAWWIMRSLEFIYDQFPILFVQRFVSVAIVIFLLPVVAGIFQLPLVLFGVLWVCRRLDRKREQESKERDPAGNALIPPESERPVPGGKLADFEVVEKPWALPPQKPSGEHVERGVRGGEASPLVDVQTLRLRKRGRRILWSVFWVFMVGSIPFLIELFLLFKGDFSSRSTLVTDHGIPSTHRWFLSPFTPLAFLPLLSLGLWWMCGGRTVRKAREFLWEHKTLLASAGAPPIVLAVLVPGLLHRPGNISIARFGDINFWIDVFPMEVLGVGGAWLAVGWFSRYHRFEAAGVFRRTLTILLVAWWILHVLYAVYPLVALPLELQSYKLVFRWLPIVLLVALSVGWSLDWTRPSADFSGESEHRTEGDDLKAPPL